MKLRSFEQMLTAYGGSDLDIDDLNSRSKMLDTYPHTVILEGEFTEFGSLEKWIDTNLGDDPPRSIFYGKTGYDYGYIEYFFGSPEYAHKVATVVPHVYTIYPESHPPGKIFKSDGIDRFVDFDPRNMDAIVPWIQIKEGDD